MSVFCNFAVLLFAVLYPLLLSDIENTELFNYTCLFPYLIPHLPIYNTSWYLASPGLSGLPDILSNLEATPTLQLYLPLAPNTWYLTSIPTTLLILDPSTVPDSSYTWYLTSIPHTTFQILDPSAVPDSSYTWYLTSISPSTFQILDPSTVPDSSPTIYSYLTFPTHTVWPCSYNPTTIPDFYPAWYLTSQPHSIRPWKYWTLQL